MLRKLIGLFIIVSPFTSYFALSAWVRLPILILVMLYFVFFAKVLWSRKVNKKLLTTTNTPDAILLIILTIIWTSFIFGFGEVRSFNHSLAYSFTFLAYFIGLKVVFRYAKITLEFLLHKFMISTVICTSIVLIDWILINTIKFELRRYFVNLENHTANMLYYTKSYFEAVGGVAEEPGSMALFMNIIAPLGLLHCLRTNRQFLFLLLLLAYLLSLLFLASMAGIANLLIAVTVAFILYCLRKQEWKISMKLLRHLIWILPLLLTVSYKFFSTISMQWRELSQKLLLDTDDVSANIRTYTWFAAFRHWGESPILGKGPGYGVDWFQAGYHSVYLTLLADTGTVSLLLFISVLFYYNHYIWCLPSTVSYVLFISFLTSVLHFSVVGDFYHAPFWLLLITIQWVKEENDRLMSYVK